jgi:outer membrane protein assembly factor BamB
VLAEPRPLVKNNVYIPNSVQLVAFNVKSGTVAWRKDIYGDGMTPVADDARLYIRLGLPRVSYDFPDYEHEVNKCEIVTFQWSDGIMGWNVPCPNTGDMFVWNGRLLLASQGRNGSGDTLAAVDAATGKEQWRVDAHGGIDGMFPARDRVYVYDESRDPEGEFLHTVDPATGLYTQTLPFNPQYTIGTHVTVLEWLPRAQVLVGTIAKDRTPGSNFYQIRALHADGTPAWDRPDTSSFKVAANTLICESYKEGRGGLLHDIVALDPATGYELWKRAAAIDASGYYDLDLGEWHGQAVILQGNQLLGLNPLTGKTLWTLEVLPAGQASVMKQTRIVGDVIIIAFGGNKNRPPQVRAYGLK